MLILLALMVLSTEGKNVCDLEEISEDEDDFQKFDLDDLSDDDDFFDRIDPPPKKFKSSSSDK